MVRLGEHDPKFLYDQCVANLRSENNALKQSLYELATEIEYAIELGCLSANPGLVQKIDGILDIVELQLQN